jgi:hypothetical protein
MVRPDASGQFSQQSGTWVLGFAIGRPVPHGTGASGRAPREVQHGEELIGRAMRPVTRDRTCPVAMGALWTTTGRWYCLVRLLRGARPVNASRACGAVRSARPVIAFDRWRTVTVEIGRSVLNTEGHVDDAWRPDAVQRVRSARPARSVVACCAQ